jgi:DNA-binding FrmR family transcriptional regulator
MDTALDHVPSKGIQDHLDHCLEDVSDRWRARQSVDEFKEINRYL